MPTKSAVPWQWAALSAGGVLGLSIVSAGLGKPADMEAADRKSDKEAIYAIYDSIKRRAGGIMPTLLPWTLKDDGQKAKTLSFLVK